MPKQAGRVTEVSMKIRIFPVLLLVVLLTLTLGACSTSDQAAIEPFENIPGGIEGPSVRNIGPHSAKVIFRAGTPIVCNVAYGPDTGYGKLTLMAMTGPITDHEVDLLGLQPDTTYHYRITATDATSRVYRSEDFVFTTTADTREQAPLGPNLATIEAGARVVAVSSNWGGGDLNSSFGANQAIDGNDNTEWSSDGDGDGAWIEIELAQSYELSAIGFWTRTMGNSAQVSSFKVIVDGATELGPFELNDAATLYYFDVSVKAKRLRFEVESSSGGNTGAVAIGAYAR